MNQLSLEFKRRATLTRFFSSGEGTPGMLFFTDGQTSEHWETIELPDRDNQQNLSCIPAGVYVCRYRVSPSKGPCYHVTNVAGRGWILMHPGNFAGNTELGLKTHSLGCILLGTKHGRLGGQRAILRSKPAVLRFLEEMDRDDLLLTIKNLWETPDE